MNQPPPTHDLRLTTDDSSLATAPISSSRRVHNPALDGMRGLGIVGVMVVHFSGIDLPTLRAPAVGAPFLEFVSFVLGVPLFFVLSGFLITGILLEARDKPRYFRDFFGRRVIRIFPLYYGVLAVLFLVRPVWGRAIGGTSSPRWLWLYLSNFEIARRGGWSYNYLSHFWSLAVEEQYYLVWPFIVLAFRPRWLLGVCAVLGASSLILRIVLTIGWKHTIGAYVLTPCQLDPLCTGGALAILVRKWPQERLRPFARLAVFGSLAAFVLLGWYRLPKTSRQQIVGRPILSCFLFGGVILLSIGDSGFLRRFLGSRPLAFLGKYSYGIYAFHFPLLPFFRLCFPAAVLGSPFHSAKAGFTISVVLSILATTALAVLSYELVEKRFLRLKKWFAG